MMQLLFLLCVIPGSAASWCLSGTACKTNELALHVNAIGQLLNEAQSQQQCAFACIPSCCSFVVLLVSIVDSMQHLSACKTFDIVVQQTTNLICIG